jgi:hypothetical protein
MTDAIITALLAHDEPAIQWKTRVGALAEAPDSPGPRALQEQVRTSPAVQTLLSERDGDGRIPGHPYQKWSGANWVLWCLADLGYPSGDEGLRPLVDQELAWLTSPAHRAHARLVDGRWRRCASQEGNGVYGAVVLGLMDSRVDELVARLLTWAWPDGGWNCDKNRSADTSSFHETLIPLRALNAYARATGSREAAAGVARAAEVFLSRRLFRRKRDGEVIHPSFLELSYPSYWHYDVLSGLKVLGECDLLGDPRCGEALDWLESKRLSDGGFPSTHCYYNCRNARYPNGRYASGRSVMNWGGRSTRRMNPWVTVDALAVLRRASRA